MARRRVGAALTRARFVHAACRDAQRTLRRAYGGAAPAHGRAGVEERDDAITTPTADRNAPSGMLSTPTTAPGTSSGVPGMLSTLGGRAPAEREERDDAPPAEQEEEPPVGQMVSTPGRQASVMSEHNHGDRESLRSEKVGSTSWICRGVGAVVLLSDEAGEQGRAGDGCFYQDRFGTILGQ